MHSLFGNGLFRFAVCLCVAEVSVFVLSWICHVANPAFESMAWWFEARDVPGGTDLQVPTSDEIVAMIGSNLAASGVRHWSISPADGIISFGDPPTFNKLFASVRRFCHLHFTKERQSDFFRLELIDPDPVTAKRHAEAALASASEQVKKIDETESRRVFAKTLKEWTERAKSLRLQGDDMSARSVESEIAYAQNPRNIGCWNFHFHVWDWPPVGKEVLLFQSPLTQILTLIASAVVCIILRLLRGTRGPNLIHVAA